MVYKDRILILARGGATKVEIAFSSLGEAVGRLHVGVCQAFKKTASFLAKIKNSMMCESSDSQHVLKLLRKY